MQHQLAIDRRLTERYLLGELSPDEAAEFEAHFFECAVCADEVRQGAHLVANLKAVLRVAEGFVHLTIALNPSEIVPRIECVFQFETSPALVIPAFAEDGSIRLKLPADRVPSGPCMVVLRDQDSQRELGQRRLEIVKPE